MYAARQAAGPSGAPRTDYAPPILFYVGRGQNKAASFAPETVGARRMVEEVVFNSHFEPWLEAGGRLTVEGKTYEVIAAQEPAGAYRSELQLTCRHLAGVTMPPA